MANRLLNYLTFVTTFVTLLHFLSTASLASAASKCQTTNQVITEGCNSTHFPTLCCISLTPYTSTITNKQALCEAAINTTVSNHDNVLRMLTDMSNDEGVKANTTEDSFYGIINCMLDFGDAYVPIEGRNVTFNGNGSNVELVVNEVKEWIDIAVDKYKLCFRELNESGVTGPLKMKIVSAVTRALKLARITSSLFKTLL